MMMMFYDDLNCKYYINTLLIQVYCKVSTVDSYVTVGSYGLT